MSDIIRQQAKDLLKSQIEKIAVNGVSKREACRRISKLLKYRWSSQYLSHVAYRDHVPSLKLSRAIMNIPERTRTPQLWVKVIFETQEDKDYALSLDMEERRRRILG